MRIAGNLDVEVTWARMDAAARRARGERAPSEGDPRFALPEPVMRKISAAATLLRVFAESDDDVLWTPRAVDPSRMARVEWLPTPRLESGPLPESADVWWGEPTEVAARVNHREWAWQAKVRHLIPRLPGGTICRNFDALRDAAGELLGRDGYEPWVAKAPLSAAGRLRVRSDGALGDKERAQAERLLDLFGVLLFEPWVDRVADFGVLGEVGETTTVCRAHGLKNDRAGRFVGIWTQLTDDASTSLGLGAAARAMGDALRDAGYSGPYGVDAFTYRTPNGPRLQSVSEVNARHTFGLVAHVLAERRKRMAESPRVEPLTFRFGRGAPPADTTPLLFPGPDDDTSAWLEFAPRHGG